jgi:hypothetical protein
MFRRPSWRWRGNLPSTLAACHTIGWPRVSGQLRPSRQQVAALFPFSCRAESTTFGSVCDGYSQPDSGTNYATYISLAFVALS